MRSPQDNFNLKLQSSSPAITRFSVLFQERPTVSIEAPANLSYTEKQSYIRAHQAVAWLNTKIDEIFTFDKELIQQAGQWDVVIENPQDANGAKQYTIRLNGIVFSDSLAENSEICGEMIEQALKSFAEKHATDFGVSVLIYQALDSATSELTQVSTSSVSPSSSSSSSSSSSTDSTNLATSSLPLPGFGAPSIPPSTSSSSSSSASSSSSSSSHSVKSSETFLSPQVPEVTKLKYPTSAQYIGQTIQYLLPGGDETAIPRVVFLKNNNKNPDTLQINFSDVGYGRRIFNVLVNRYTSVSNPSVRDDPPFNHFILTITNLDEIFDFLYMCCELSAEKILAFLQQQTVSSAQDIMDRAPPLLNRKVLRINRQGFRDSIAATMMRLLPQDKNKFETIWSEQQAYQSKVLPSIGWGAATKNNGQDFGSDFVIMFNSEQAAYGRKLLTALSRAGFTTLKPDARCSEGGFAFSTNNTAEIISLIENFCHFHPTWTQQFFTHMGFQNEYEHYWQSVSPQQTDLSSDPVIRLTQAQIPKEEKLAEYFEDPINLEEFIEPCICLDGQTYSREIITTYLQSKSTSPITREPLSSQQIYSNQTVLEFVKSFRQGNINMLYCPVTKRLLTETIVTKDGVSYHPDVINGKTPEETKSDCVNYKINDEIISFLTKPDGALLRNLRVQSITGSLLEEIPALPRDLKNRSAVAQFMGASPSMSSSSSSLFSSTSTTAAAADPASKTIPLPIINLDDRPSVQPSTSISSADGNASFGLFRSWLQLGDSIFNNFSSTSTLSPRTVALYAVRYLREKDATSWYVQKDDKGKYIPHQDNRCITKPKGSYVSNRYSDTLMKNLEYTGPLGLIKTSETEEKVSLSINNEDAIMELATKWQVEHPNSSIIATAEEILIDLEEATAARDYLNRATGLQWQITRKAKEYYIECEQGYSLISDKELGTSTMVLQSVLAWLRAHTSCPELAANIGLAKDQYDKGILLQPGQATITKISIANQDHVRELANKQRSNEPIHSRSFH